MALDRLSTQTALADPDAEDATLLDGLRRGEESAFATLIDRHQPAMLRIAAAHVPTRASAEEVVQETWLAVLRGIDRFEGRSSLKTWIFRILVNRAISHGRSDRRCIPLSSLAPADDEGPTVDPDRFQGTDGAYPRHWLASPANWGVAPEDRLLAGETRERVLQAIADLPARQQQVIVLRDVQGWPPEEVCDALAVSEGNQRVLLHRARAHVRRALDAYLGADA